MGAEIRSIALLLLFLFSMPMLKGATISGIEAYPQIEVVSQTYIDSYFDWKFTQINSSVWGADFVINPALWSNAKDCLSQPVSSKTTCFTTLCLTSASLSSNESVKLGLNCSDPVDITKLTADFSNMSSYPLTAVTKDIQFSNFVVDLAKGSGTFLISFPNGFKEGESAKFGFGTTVINTSTTAQSVVMFGQQGRTFYAAGLFWAFYTNGTNISYSCSVGGLTFVNQTAVRPCNTGDCYAADFSVWYNGTYISYAYSDRSTQNTPMYYRRGTPNSDCSITWSAAEQTAISAAASKTFRYPNLAIDDQGYPWIAYVNNTADTTVYPFITKSSTNDGTWTTASGFAYQLNFTSSTAYTASIVPLTGGKVLAAYCTGSGRLYIRSHSGSAWNALVNSSSTCDYANMHDVVAEGDNAHFVFISASAIIYLNYTYATNKRSAETTLITGGITTTTHPYLTYNGTGTLYMFYSKVTSGVGTINYTTKNQSNSWSGRTLWFTLNNLTNTADYMAPFYQNYGGYIGLMAMQNYTPSLFNITFNFLNYSAGAPPSQYSRNVSDSFLYSGQDLRTAALTRSLINSVNYGEVRSRTAVLTRILSDSVAYSEYATRLAVLTRFLLSSVSYGENQIRIAAFTKNLQDSLTYGELQTKYSEFIRYASSSVVYSELTDRVAIRLQAVSDYLVYAEQVWKSISITRSLSDSVAYGERALRYFEIMQTVYDSIAYGEAQGKTLSLVKSISDSLLYSEQLVTNYILTRIASSYVTYGESVHRTIDIVIRASDYATYKELIYKFAGFTITLIDQVTHSEGATRIKGIIRSVSDFLSYSEVVSTTYTLLKVLLGGTTITFPCSATTSQGEFTNVSFYINTNGTWARNETQNITGVVNQTNFTKTLEYGRYVWNCEFCTVASCGFYINNHTVDVNITGPQLVQVTEDEPPHGWLDFNLLLFIVAVSLFLLGIVTQDPLLIIASGVIFALLGVSLYINGVMLNSVTISKTQEFNQTEHEQPASMLMTETYAPLVWTSIITEGLSLLFFLLGVSLMFYPIYTFVKTRKGPEGLE